MKRLAHHLSCTVLMQLNHYDEILPLPTCHLAGWQVGRSRAFLATVTRGQTSREQRALFPSRDQPFG